MDETCKALYWLMLKHEMSAAEIYHKFFSREQMAATIEVQSGGRGILPLNVFTTERRYIRSQILSIDGISSIDEVQSGIVRLLANYGHTIPLRKRILRMQVGVAYWKIVNMIFGDK